MISNFDQNYVFLIFSLTFIPELPILYRLPNECTNVLIVQAGSCVIFGISNMHMLNIKIDENHRKTNLHMILMKFNVRNLFLIFESNYHIFNNI